MRAEKLTIGVLGGMGPYATVDLFKRLVDAFPTEKDWEKPRILIDSYAPIPSRVRAILYGERTEELLSCMVTSIRWLMNAGADRIIIACNTAHAFLPDIIDRFPACEGRVLNMIELCAEECKRRGYHEVHLLASEGTVRAGIYEKAFGGSGIQIGTPDEHEMGNIRDLIEDVKQNRISEESLRKFVRLLAERRCPVIFGCTELPVLYGRCRGDCGDPQQFVDPLQSAIDALLTESSAHSRTAMNSKADRGSWPDRSY